MVSVPHGRSEIRSQRAITRAGMGLAGSTKDGNSAAVSSGGDLWCNGMSSGVFPAIGVDDVGNNGK